MVNIISIIDMKYYRKTGDIYFNVIYTFLCVWEIAMRLNMRINKSIVSEDFRRRLSRVSRGKLHPGCCQGTMETGFGALNYVR